MKSTMSRMTGAVSQHKSVTSLSMCSLGYSSTFSLKSFSQRSPCDEPIDEPIELPEKKPTEREEQTNLEIRIISEFMLGVLDEAIYKIKMAMCLPEVVKLKELLLETLTMREYSELYSVHRRSTPGLRNSGVSNKDVKTVTASLRGPKHPDLARIVRYLYKCKNIREIVEEFIRKKLECEDADVELVFLQDLVLMRRLLAERLATPAAARLVERLNFKFVQSSNKTLLKEISELENKIKQDKNTFEEKMARKFARKEQLEQKLYFLRQQCDMDIEKNLLDSGRQMVLASRAHATHYELLREEEQAWRESNEQILGGHLREEKTLRTRRTKVYAQLLSWVQKYDLEMAEKQKELDQMAETLTEETAVVADLEAKKQEQDKDYIPLMEEREREYDEELASKMRAFLRDHSARILQAAWRAVMENRREKLRRAKLAEKLKREE